MRAKLNIFLIIVSPFLLTQAMGAKKIAAADQTPQGICLSAINATDKRFASDISIWGSAYAGRTHFPRRIDTQGSNVFVFDPKGPGWAAYNSRGRLIKTGYASGGKNYCPDVGRRCLTPVGSFRVHSKGSSACKSSKYPLGKGGAPMPHCMFFYRGYAIHGSPNVPNYNASHGCIRVLPKDAAWLHRHFMGIGTRVIVKSYR